jgi:hypothetical protein
LVTKPHDEAFSSLNYCLINIFQLKFNQLVIKLKTDNLEVTKNTDNGKLSKEKVKKDKQL